MIDFISARNRSLGLSEGIAWGVRVIYGMFRSLSIGLGMGTATRLWQSLCLDIGRRVVLVLILDRCCVFASFVPIDFSPCPTRPYAALCI